MPSLRYILNIILFGFFLIANSHGVVAADLLKPISDNEAKAILSSMCNLIQLTTKVVDKGTCRSKKRTCQHYRLKYTKGCKQVEKANCYAWQEHASICAFTTGGKVWLLQIIEKHF